MLEEKMVIKCSTEIVKAVSTNITLNFYKTLEESLQRFLGSPPETVVPASVYIAFRHVDVMMNSRVFEMVRRILRERRQRLLDYLNDCRAVWVSCIQFMVSADSFERSFGQSFLTTTGHMIDKAEYEDIRDHVKYLIHTVCLLFFLCVCVRRAYLVCPVLNDNLSRDKFVFERVQTTRTYMWDALHYILNNVTEEVLTLIVNDSPNLVSSILSSMMDLFYLQSKRKVAIFERLGQVLGSSLFSFGLLPKPEDVVKGLEKSYKMSIVDPGLCTQILRSMLLFLRIFPFSDGLPFVGTSACL